MRHGLTDEQWHVIEDLFPEPAMTGRPPANPRQMLPQPPSSAGRVT